MIRTHERASPANQVLLRTIPTQHRWSLTVRLPDRVHCLHGPQRQQRGDYNRALAPMRQVLGREEIDEAVKSNMEELQPRGVFEGGSQVMEQRVDQKSEHRPVHGRMRPMRFTV